MTTYYVYQWTCQTCGRDNEFHDNLADDDYDVSGYCDFCEDEERRGSIIQLLAEDQFLVESE